MANGVAGRPEVELTAEEIAEVETLAAVLSTQDIADYFGIGRTTFYALMERNPAISERYKKGRAKAKTSIAGNLIKKARAGDTTSQIFYLKTQCGWRETQHIDHSSTDGSMTPQTIERIFVDETSDQDTEMD
jgi:IS30 family transposase